jgi:hypothetical protein
MTPQLGELADEETKYDEMPLKLESGLPMGFKQQVAAVKV